MSLTVVTQQEHQNALDRIAVLEEKMQALAEQLQHVTKQPSKWIIKSEANKYFIGKGGKVLSRQIFLGMINRLIEAGVLVNGVNYYRDTVGTMYLSEDFLRGKFTTKVSSVRLNKEKALRPCEG